MQPIGAVVVAYNHGLVTKKLKGKDVAEGTEKRVLPVPVGCDREDSANSRDILLELIWKQDLYDIRESEDLIMHGDVSSVYIEMIKSIFYQFCATRLHWVATT
jgi:hypothetical protein